MTFWTNNLDNLVAYFNDFKFNNIDFKDTLMTFKTGVGNCIDSIRLFGFMN